MPICPDCRPFAPKDTDNDPDVDVSIDQDKKTGAVTVSGTVRIVNTCSNCSQELEETTFEVEIDMTAIATAHREAHKGESHEFEIDNADGERFDELQRFDRRGKPIKNYRYMKHLYGARVTVSLGCSCGEPVEGEGEFADSIAASYMDELV